MAHIGHGDPLGALVLVAVNYGRDLLQPPAPAESIAMMTATSTPTLTVALLDNSVQITTTPTLAPTPTPEFVSTRFVTPTPHPNGQVLTIAPRGGEAGWLVSNDSRLNHLGDSYLYAGRFQGQDFISIARFDIGRTPRGADIHQVILQITGLKVDRFVADDNALWLVQLLPGQELQDLSRADYLTALSAPAAITLPPLRAAALSAGATNQWELDDAARAWLAQQLLDGATSLMLRIQPATNGPDTLFAWDSGMGPESAGNPPSLIISVGPPPPTPPPLPTKPFIVATLTPVPANVLTVVALAATATNVAETIGTYTPVPYQVYTPTPFPANLETVQAVAVGRGLPVVALDTPTPANAAIATGNADYATAVALTTGTFTPVPTDYVTPMIVPPSPPAENVATAAARVVAVTATAEAASSLLLPTPTYTPLPYNAVIGVYVYATATPGNVATAAAVAVIAEANAKVNGTPTPLPWNALLITPVPPTVAPLPTPLPLIVPDSDFTPTPEPTATVVVPDALPVELRNKIVFFSDRSGKPETYVMDPATGAISLITQSWVHPLASRQLTVSPDGKRQAIVQADSNGVLQIKIYSVEYGTTKEITTQKGTSYDPTWSPGGDLIAFVSTDSGGDEIYTVDPEGVAVTRLTVNGWEWDKHPSWSPDGSQIVFYSNRESGRRQIWVMNRDGTGQRNLSNNDYNDWDPVWTH